MFTIAETGFGTGLNFYAAAMSFLETSKPDQKLHYISFEKNPLAWHEIEKALSQWKEQLSPIMDLLRPVYPLRVAGFHRVQLSPQILLTLIFDDVNHAMPQLDVPCGVDAWFLDGFAPAKNPQMWTDTLFSGMARLSHDKTSFATFTAAGAVKRGLESAGFAVEKCAGFGRKRDMMRGQFTRNKKQMPFAIPHRVAIIGGGLAGTAAAYLLKKNGIEPVIFESGPELAHGASGNDLGLYNPRLSMNRTADSDFFASAFALAHRTFSNIGCDIGFDDCGSLHLATDEEKERRLRGALANWGWHTDHMQWGEGGLFLPDAGIVSPRMLCQAYARNIDVRLNTPIKFCQELEDYSAVILACGASVRRFKDCEDLPIHTVRGQVTALRENQYSQSIKRNICFGGYLSPAQNGIHMTGATFQPWRTDTDVTDEDHRENINRLEQAVPGLGNLEVIGGRAALRTASKDRFPVIGKFRDGLYLSTAHGSHGIISSLMAAHIICDDLLGTGSCLPAATIARCRANRF